LQKLVFLYSATGQSAVGAVPKPQAGMLGSYSTLYDLRRTDCFCSTPL